MYDQGDHAYGNEIKKQQIELQWHNDEDLSYVMKLF